MGVIGFEPTQSFDNRVTTCPNSPALADSLKPLVAVTIRCLNIDNVLCFHYTNEGKHRYVVVKDKTHYWGVRT